MNRRDQIVFGLMALPHKAGVNPEDWKTMAMGVLEVAWATITVCQARNLPILFTSLIRPKVPASETCIHEMKRAFDMSIHGWTVDDIDEVIIEVNRLCAKAWGAYKAGDPDMIPRALIYEHKKGEGPDSKAFPYVKENKADPHLHGQCRP